MCDSSENASARSIWRFLAKTKQWFKKGYTAGLMAAFAS